jgi:hypothetical protein
MSMFITQIVHCPACEHAFEIEVVESVNADRRPDLREEILAGTFQVQTCPDCGAEFRVDPMFNYLDMVQGLWVAAMPLSELANWVEREDQATSTFESAYGSKAPGPARDIGSTLSPRLVFGWAALREKVFLASAGLNDVTAELSKLAIIRGLGGAPIQPGIECRIEDKTETSLHLSWIRAQSDETIDALSAPLSLPESVESAEGAWAPIRTQLTDGPFVDIQKLWIGDGRDAA